MIFDPPRECEWPRCRGVATIAVESGKAYCDGHYHSVMTNRVYLWELTKSKSEEVAWQKQTGR